MRDARQIETDEDNELYQIALVLLALRTAKALEEYMALNAAAAPSGAVAVAMLARASALISRARAQARALSLARVSLVRALGTGHGVWTPEQHAEATLDDLRDRFAALVEAQGVRAPSVHVQSPTAIAGDTVITLEEVFSLAELPSDSMTRASEVKREMRKLSNLITQAQAGQIHDRALQQQLETIKSNIAAEVSKDVMDAGRAVTDLTAYRDQRVAGWVRVAGSYDPCAFCMMLMSRGPVYRSEKTAKWAGGAVGNKYHPNCQCEVMLMYRTSDYWKSSQTKFNRDLEKFWQKNISNQYSNEGALNYLRRWRYANRHQKLRVALEAA